MRDGGFIVVVPTEDAPRGSNKPGAQAIDLVLNWFTELQQRVPGR